MSPLEIRALAPNEALDVSPALMDSFTFTGMDSWTCLVTQTYGYATHRFTAIENDHPQGHLTLSEVRHPIFGHYLTTSPFGSYGGFAYSTVQARNALLKAAEALANAQGVEHVNVRFEAGAGEAPLEGWSQHPAYSTYRVELSADTESMLKNFGSDHRNHIRKSLKKGFAVKFGRADLLDDAYEGMARSMHELGSPYHTKAYLQGMMDELGDALEFVTMYDVHGSLAGAGVFITQGDVVTNLHANMLRAFRNAYAGEFLYWSVIERYAQKGLHVLDLGRSLNGSGNETFKLKWKPRKVPLAYWYYLPKGGAIPELNQKSPKFQFAIWMWKRLPAFVVRMLGPHLIRGIA